MIDLLDTDTLIFMIRGMKSPGRRSSVRKRAERLVERCPGAQRSGDVVAISSITLSELEFGARKSRNYQREVNAFRKETFPFEMLEHDPIACPFYYGEIRYAIEQNGRTIGAMDLLIAAHARAVDAVLVTKIPLSATMDTFCLAGSRRMECARRCRGRYKTPRISPEFTA